MRIFKRLRKAEKDIECLFGIISKITNSNVTILKTMTSMQERIEAVEKENEDLRKQLDDIKNKLPDYEEAISKGVERKWDDAVQAVADFNPYVELNKEAIGR
jgi:predicted  nucleic acid-binding Zn-ribbon protein